MTTPVRLQLSRRKGFDLQAHSRAVNDLPAINVARPTAHGNRYVIGRVITHVDDRETFVEDAAHAKRLFAEWLEWQMQHFKTMRAGLKHELGNRNLACWCDLCPAHAKGKPAGIICSACPPCHVDVYFEVLLDLANGER
jgi:hypothetical protein